MKLNVKLCLVAMTSIAVPIALFLVSYYALHTSTAAVEAQYRNEMVPTTLTRRSRTAVATSLADTCTTRPAS